jgi:hypothetical protein
VTQLRDRYVTAKPLANAFGIAAAVLFCALVFWCVWLAASHRCHAAELTRQLRSLYESVARRRADIINERLTANVRQLEQARQRFPPSPALSSHAPVLATSRICLR